MEEDNEIIEFYSAHSSKLNEIKLVPNKIIFCYDTQVMYIDNNGLRLPYNVIKIFRNDTVRENLINPTEGFYYTETEGVLWRYKDGWKQLTSNNANQVFIGNKITDFPLEGNSATLYTTGDAVYRYIAATKEYVCISNKTDWKMLGV